MAGGKSFYFQRAGGRGMIPVEFLYLVLVHAPVFQMFTDAKRTYHQPDTLLDIPDCAVIEMVIMVIRSFQWQQLPISEPRV